MLDETERAKVIKALKQWAASAPDEPVLGFLGDDALLRPREILAAVKDQTQPGEDIMVLLEHGIRREGMDEFVKRLTRSSANDSGLMRAALG